MSRRVFTGLMLSAIALVSLPSCTAPTGTATTTPQSAPEAQTAALKIGGSSSTAPIIKTLAAAYEGQSKSKISVLEPGQSESVIAGVKQNLVDVGVVSKQLKPEDLGESLASRTIAKDALLVATHSSVTGVKNLTTDDLKGIYCGKIRNWKDLGGPDATIVVLDRPEDESAKKLLRKHYLGDDLVNAPEAVILKKEGELVAALQSTPHSIGAFSLANAIANKLPVTQLSLNGIAPNAETIQSGQYLMVRQIEVVYQKKPTLATQQFIDFSFSATGLQQLSQAGFVPAGAQ